MYSHRIRCERWTINRSVSVEYWNHRSNLHVNAQDVGVGDSIECTATAVDTAGETIQSTDSVQLDNTPPTLSTVAISPNANVVSSDVLVCSATATDPDETVTPTYTWSVNGSVEGSGDTLDLSTITVMPQDTVQCDVSVVDSEGASASDSLVVVTIKVQRWIVCTLRMRCYYQFLVDLSATVSDLDGEVLTPTYVWFDGSGNTLGSGATLTLSPSTVSPGENVTCTASVSDAYGGLDSDSSSVTVDNATPTVDSVSVTPNTAVDSETLLTCAYTASDADGDVLTGT